MAVCDLWRGGTGLEAVADEMRMETAATERRTDMERAPLSGEHVNVVRLIVA